MKEKLFLEGIDLLLEETATIVLKRGSLTGKPVFTGSINNDANKDKEFPLDKLPKGIINKIITQLEKNHPQVSDLESLKKFILEQPKAIRFSMIGNRLRLINDGSKKSEKFSSAEAVARYKMGRMKRGS